MSEEKKTNCNCGADCHCGQDGDCCSKHHGRTAIIIIGMLLLSSVVVVSILRDRIVNQQFKSVTVTGQGRVSYTPDIAIVTLGVQIDKVAKPEDALNQLNAKVANIIKEIKAAGIKAEDIQTQNYSLYPQYDYKDNISVVSGYNANEQLVVKVTGYDQNQDRLSQVIAAASRAGANQVNNLSFDAANMNDLKQQARVKAIADARAKSTALANAASVELKDITGWYENLVNPVPVYSVMDYGKGGANAGTPASPSTPAGDREVVIEIGVTYNLK
ncbi:MAG: SIMPL domain-containing protein [Patescibacteria group bacterium]